MKLARPVVAAILAAVVSVITGCATPQKPVAFQPETVNWRAARVGVAMTPLPKVDTHMPGANCLLCIAAASVANSSLVDHSRTLPVEDLPRVKARIADAIRAKGGKVVVIEEPLEVSKLAEADKSAENAAPRNFRPLREQYGIDKLIVVEVSALGMWRTYSAYFPTSDPKATLQGRGYMVDLATNTYDWLQPVTVLRASDKVWDEPPKYPGLTNAYFQVLEVGSDEFVKPFQ